MPTTQAKPKKKAPKPASNKMYKGILIGFMALCVVVAIVLKSSLFKDYPIEGKKQKLSITNGETYTGFIDQLAEDKKVSFPIILKLYRKVFIHDTMKAGVYEVTQGMSVREVLDMVSNADNAQMSRLLVIEGTTAKQLIQTLRQDNLIQKSVVNLPTAQLLKELNIPYEHPEGLFAPDTYFFDKGESDKKDFD